MIPDGCVGLPTLAAVEQGIPVVAVRSNTNLMRNDLRSLPFRAGQLHYASNYYEAAGILAGDEGGRCSGDDWPGRCSRCGSSALRRVEADAKSTARPPTARERQRSMATANGNGKVRRSKAAAAEPERFGRIGGGWRQVTGRLDHERAPIFETLTNYAALRHLRLPHARPQRRPLCRR